MLGILASNPTQEELTKISDLEKDGIDYCVFSSSILDHDTKQIPQLQPFRAYGFKGILIATDIKTAELATQLVSPRKKFFYITCMEWTEAPVLIYDALKKIYLSDDMDLVVSNENDYKIISNLFKEPKHLIEEWNFSEIYNEHQK